MAGDGVGGAGNSWWDDDDALAAALDTALREASDVPAGFVAAGKAAFAWHGVDAELAQLRHDSATADPDEQYAAATRAGPDDPAVLRTLSFAADRLTVELDLTAEAVLGQIVPAQPGQVEVRAGDAAPGTVSIDEDGWFTIRPIPAGPFRLRCVTADGTAVLTGWISPTPPTATPPD
ncbi:MAG TPA: hypothetical protein VMU51_19130 [Mycobacteriales bacterium]|nr:hypothetical protein [Mycobacteriales bacterium]